MVSRNPLVRTEKFLQFWRESEQRWVDHVCIWRSECSRFGGVDPVKWRHRITIITTETGDWQEGRG